MARTLMVIKEETYLVYPCCRLFHKNTVKSPRDKPGHKTKEVSRQISMLS